MSRPRSESQTGWPSVCGWPWRWQDFLGDGGSLVKHHHIVQQPSRWGLIAFETFLYGANMSAVSAAIIPVILLGFFKLQTWKLASTNINSFWPRTVPDIPRPSEVMLPFGFLVLYYQLQSLSGVLFPSILQRGLMLSLILIHCTVQIKPKV